jgi:large subunit ribosomal protein L30
MAFAIIRVRGQADVNYNIRHTMELIGLNKVNHCVVMPETDSMKGMLQMIKDYCTWGEVDSETLAEMIRQRGKIDGGDDLSEDFLKENTEFANADEMAKAIIENDYRMKNVEGAKPIFRLHPPRKGYEGIKRSYVSGGALGYRGKDINILVKRML